MTPLLTQVELLDKRINGLKERIFEWIVELPQPEFDQLCCEIIGLHHFVEKYKGVLISDILFCEKGLDRVCRVELIINFSSRHFNRNKFYQWLTLVRPEQLQVICWELELLCDEVMENVGTHVIHQSDPIPAQQRVCWMINDHTSFYLPYIHQTIQSWQL